MCSTEDAYDQTIVKAYPLYLDLFTPVSQSLHRCAVRCWRAALALVGGWSSGLIFNVDNQLQAQVGKESRLLRASTSSKILMTSLRILRRSGFWGSGSTPITRHSRGQASEKWNPEYPVSHQAGLPNTGYIPVSLSGPAPSAREDGGEQAASFVLTRGRRTPCWDFFRASLGFLASSEELEESETASTQLGLRRPPGTECWVALKFLSNAATAESRASSDARYMSSRNLDSANDSFINYHKPILNPEEDDVLHLPPRLGPKEPCPYSGYFGDVSRPDVYFHCYLGEDGLTLEKHSVGCMAGTAYDDRKEACMAIEKEVCYRPRRIGKPENRRSETPPDRNTAFKEASVFLDSFPFQPPFSGAAAFTIELSPEKTLIRFQQLHFLHGLSGFLRFFLQSRRLLHHILAASNNRVLPSLELCEVQRLVSEDALLNNE
ncbi:unnamed protein product [Cyprideis torosa]|uniref:Uncharacterized protein n=1 Tax=Cyprideis torosa TaxID=163714 RepID=A0A7R8WE04_9CRUS|nr:unnamed protein product [Cyprideis torosa]CAG0893782.1 unnamed protein product [Cyprideis torosa]